MRAIILTDREAGELEQMVDIATMGCKISIEISKAVVKFCPDGQPDKAQLEQNLADSTERMDVIREIARKLRECVLTADTQSDHPKDQIAPA